MCRAQVWPTGLPRPPRSLLLSPPLQAVCELLLSFAAPVRQVSAMQLREALQALALLQQSHRPALHVSSSPLDQLPHQQPGYLRYNLDLRRCMGFAAAAYGSVAMNFLELLPRGTFSTDVLALLVPGVTREHVLQRGGGGGGGGEGGAGSGYLLVMDHRRREVVLAVRGSLLPRDLITDLTCAPARCANIFSGASEATLRALAEHEQGSEPEEPLAHEGFLIAANELDARLREAVRGALQASERVAEEEGAYQLLLCGHSLGEQCWQGIFVQCSAVM